MDYKRLLTQVEKTLEAIEAGTIGHARGRVREPVDGGAGGRERGGGFDRLRVSARQALILASVATRGHREPLRAEGAARPLRPRWRTARGCASVL